MDKDERQLLTHFGRLPPAERATLLAFAEFLAARVVEAAPLPEPQPIPRPVTESVIAAVKRLSATYPMVNKDKLLHQASGLVSEHLMQGRPAVEVIDELEIIFRRHYETLRGS
jgi:hypothetical protein